MADASGDALNALQSQTSLKYGDYNVTKDWKYYISPVNGAYGESSLMVFNPNDTTQRFFLDNPAEHEQLHNFGLGTVQGTDIGRYYADPTGNYNTSYYADLFSNYSLSDLEEQKRQQALVEQYQAGELTRRQMDAVVSGSAAPTTPENYGVPTTYQDAYNASKQQSAEQEQARLAFRAQQEANKKKTVKPSVVSSSNARNQTSLNMNELQQAQTFYLPSTPVAGYDPKTIFNSKGKAVSADEYRAQGGLADYSNVKPIANIGLIPSSASSPAQNFVEQNINSKLPQLINEIYSARPDLQQLYNPDGSAKNPNDPRIAGIPTMQDWAKKYGTKEVPSLGKLFSEIDRSNELVNEQAQTVALASEAANNKDFFGLDSLMKDLKAMKAERAELTKKISESMKMTANEIKASNELMLLKQSARQGLQNIEGKAIDMPFIVGQQREMSRDAELKITAAAETLQALTNQRTSQREALEFLYNANAQESADLIQNYKLTAPENMYTEVDEKGNLISVFRNPVTGETLKQNLGKVGSNKQWEANKAYAAETGIDKPFYSRDGRTIINTNTGREYETWEQFLADGGNSDSSNVLFQTQARTMERAAVADMASKYWDAGIGFNDSWEVASQKAKKSAIYLDSIRPPSSGNGGNPDVSANPFFKAALTANSVRQRALELKSYAASSGQTPLDAWQQVATEIASAGGVAKDFDRTLWDVFRPGEASQHGIINKGEGEGSGVDTDGDGIPD